MVQHVLFAAYVVVDCAWCFVFPMKCCNNTTLDKKSGAVQYCGIIIGIEDRARDRYAFNHIYSTIGSVGCIHESANRICDFGA